MKNCKYLVFSFALLIIINFSAISQGKLSIHMGPSLPTKDFADDNPLDGTAGLAGIGIEGGVQYIYPLNEKGLGLLTGVDFIVNLTSKDARSNWKDINPDAVYRFPKAFNIPVSAGIIYIFNPNEKISLYGKAALAASFLKYTGFTVEESDYKDYTESYDMSTTLGYVVGLGITGNRINIGFNYMILGEHKFGGTWDEGTKDGNLDEIIKNIDLITITAGWNF
jgi:hypothetical protein